MKSDQSLDEHSLTEPRQTKSNPSATNSEPFFSFIVPTLNEAQSIGRVLAELTSIRGSKEIIIVDGGSKDGTLEACRGYVDLAFTQTGKGKGSAIREAVDRSRGKYVVVLDGDGSHQPNEVPMYVSMLNNGVGIVKGSRFMKSGLTFDMEPWRRAGNRVVVLLTNLLFTANFSDMCYGFLGLKKEIFQNLDTRETGFAIDTEIILKAKKRGVNIVEVPSVELPRKSGKSKLQALPDGLRILRVLIREAITK